MLLIHIDASWEHTMSKQPWKSVKIPLPVYMDIKKVIPWMGFSSVAEYVRYSVRERLRRDLLYVDDKIENIERERDEV